MEKDLSKLLFASDLDGTLLNSKKEISEKNKRAIDNFTARGGKFTIATGRAIPATERYAKELQLKYPCVLYNGAAIYDFAKEELVWTASLTEKAEGYLQELLDRFPKLGAEILKDNKVYVARMNEYVQQHLSVENLGYQEVRPKDVMGGWFKLLLIMESEILDEVWDYIMNRQFADVEFVKSSEHYIEMLPCNVSKGATMMRLAKMLSVEEGNTIGIGDYYNDLELIQKSGLGIAVEEAPADVKTKAALIAPGCDQDAVAWAMEKLLEKLEIF